MVVVNARRGGQFWGCTHFLKCRCTKVFREVWAESRSVAGYMESWHFFNEHTFARSTFASQCSDSSDKVLFGQFCPSRLLLDVVHFYFLCNNRRKNIIGGTLVLVDSACTRCTHSTVWDRTFNVIVWKFPKAVISRASFRRLPRNGLSLHINNIFAKKRGIGKKLLFCCPYCNATRTCWHGCGRFQRRCMAPPTWQWSSTHLHYWTNVRQYELTCATGPGGVPGEWSDVCGFLKPPGSERDWQVRMHGAFTVPFDMLGIRHTHEVWVHLLRWLTVRHEMTDLED